MSTDNEDFDDEAEGVEESTHEPDSIRRPPGLGLTFWVVAFGIGVSCLMGALWVSKPKQNLPDRSGVLLSIPEGFIPFGVVQNALNNPIGQIDKITAGRNSNGLIDRWVFHSGSNSLTIVLQ